MQPKQLLKAMAAMEEAASNQFYGLYSEVEISKHAVSMGYHSHPQIHEGDAHKYEPAVSEPTTGAGTDQGTEFVDDFAAGLVGGKSKVPIF